MRRRHQPLHLKDLDWYKYVRRYFWDDETTPYLVPVQRLHRRQADYEILAYVIFVSMLYGAVMLLAMSGRTVYADSFGVSLYALVVVCVSLALAVTRHYLAASACVLAPVGGLVFSLSFDVHPNLGNWDRVILVVFSLVWLRYTMRLMHIARRYGEMPPPPAQE